MSHASSPASPRTLDELETPRLVIDLDRLEANLRDEQAHCDRHGVELRPHIKTHKMTAIARRQLGLGAKGLTCAKIGEAEAMLPSGAKEIFIAHSIVDRRSAPRLAALAARLDRLVLAVTSEPQAAALEAVLAEAGLRLPVMMAVDTGLHREGVRSVGQAQALAATVARLPHLEPHGFYTHEGHAYGVEPGALAETAESVYRQILAIREAVDPALPIWPGCSASARLMAAKPNVQAVRPGAYVFGDLALCAVSKAMPWERAALTVLATVVDRPEPGLALIDAGSKTFSGDKTRAGDCGWELGGEAVRVIRCNEEHGYLAGPGVEALRVGDRLRFVPAHVCPVVNLADDVVVAKEEKIVEIWPVEGRGRNR